MQVKGSYMQINRGKRGFSPKRKGKLRLSAVRHRGAGFSEWRKGGKDEEPVGGGDLWRKKAPIGLRGKTCEREKKKKMFKVPRQKSLRKKGGRNHRIMKKKKRRYDVVCWVWGRGGGPVKTKKTPVPIVQSKKGEGGVVSVLPRKSPPRAGGTFPGKKKEGRVGANQVRGEKKPEKGARSQKEKRCPPLLEKTGEKKVGRSPGGRRRKTGGRDHGLPGLPVSGRGGPTTSGLGKKKKGGEPSLA